MRVAEKCGQSRAVKVERVNRAVIGSMRRVKKDEKKPEEMLLKMMKCTEKAYKEVLADLTCRRRQR